LSHSSSRFPTERRAMREIGAAIDFERRPAIVRARWLAFRAGARRPAASKRSNMQLIQIAQAETETAPPPAPAAPTPPAPVAPPAPAPVAPPPAPPTATVQSAPDAAAPPPPAPDMITQLAPLLFITLIIYFIVLRPQNRRAKEQKDALKNVRRGDTIVTSGGIVGKVTKTIDDAEVEVEIAPNVRVRILRQAISDVRAKGEPVKDQASTR
jgi:preprotein translocase subunit YajC